MIAAGSMPTMAAPCTLPKLEAAGQHLATERHKSEGKCCWQYAHSGSSLLPLDLSMARLSLLKKFRLHVSLVATNAIAGTTCMPVQTAAGAALAHTSAQANAA